MKNKEEVIKQDSIYVRDSNTGCTYSLKYEDIVYITINGYLNKYYSVNYGDLYVASGMLNGCCNLLPCFFCRLHRNLVVNMNFMKIFSAQEKYVLLSGVPVPLNISTSGVRIVKQFIIESIILSQTTYN